MRGKFITLEGVDGAGKSTHLEWLADFWRARGCDLIVTREPGGTTLGERLRELLLSEPMHAETETLLMFAARREHLHQVVMPCLEAGQWVLCDRFTDATFAYQGGGRGVAWHKVEALEQWVHADLDPDLTLYFDVSPAVGRQRMAGVRRPDRFEREQDDFFQRVRDAYLLRARNAPQRIHIVDAERSLEEIRRELTVIAEMLCQ
ncbi:MAG TPA: dTMP kinase [Burkholderiales bacterium]|nr:dTMP kinase [Burkholderiales bacterium]